MNWIPNFLRQKIMDPFLYFIQGSGAVGIILLLCTATSLWLANTGQASYYNNIINFQVPLAIIAPDHLPHTILHWINDGFMAIFFFLAGMEMKREITNGELSTLSQSILPLVGAIGGMLMPAAIFLMINKGSVYANGWGIPMATDIAFALGITTLLGSRVPLGLKIFLTALAIIDDIGAILAIAVFYSNVVHWIYLGIAAIIMTALYFLMLKNSFNALNILLGILLWYCLYNSGIHATIAGVLFSVFIPVAHLQKLEHALHIPVNFLIIPLFVLANTAIAIPANFASTITTTLSWGIIAGLVLGKPLGILISCYAVVKLKWATLPYQTSWQHIMGAGMLAGIGFTMSVFIATLAFNQGPLNDIAKIAVLGGSFCSILFGMIWLRFFCKPVTV